MNEQQQLMASVTRRILSDHCSTELLDQAEQGQYPEALWTLLEEQGLTTLGGFEALGGGGGDFCDVLVVLREAANQVQYIFTMVKMQVMLKEVINGLQLNTQHHHK